MKKVKEYYVRRICQIKEFDRIISENIIEIIQVSVLIHTYSLWCKEVNRYHYFFDQSS